jgi:DNA replicative helicase MCM subunit Mcm2 (Cdc46/Mcm family)
VQTGGFVAQNEEQRIKLQEAYLKVPEGDLSSSIIVSYLHRLVRSCDY